MGLLFFLFFRLLFEFLEEFLATSGALHSSDTYAVGHFHPGDLFGAEFLVDRRAYAFGNAVQIDFTARCFQGATQEETDQGIPDPGCDEADLFYVFRGLKVQIKDDDGVSTPTVPPYERYVEGKKLQGEGVGFFFFPDFLGPGSEIAGER